MKILKLTFAAALLFGVLTGCEREAGLGGQAEIKGVAAHHAVPIAGTRVFIKYGAKTSPGTTTTIYDDSTAADANGRFSFTELERGAYYIFGVGFDTNINMPVMAGMPVVIVEKKEVKEVTLPVTE